MQYHENKIIHEQMLKRFLVLYIIKLILIEFRCENSYGCNIMCSGRKVT